MRAMQVVQPEMKKRQDKYKKELERAKLDPVKKREVQGRQQREMMALYKEHGTNPFASCLPLIVQMPFFTALYRLLYNVANGASLFFMTPALVISARQAHKAAKKAAKNGEPADEVPAATGSRTKGAGAKSVNGTAAKATGAKATGVKEIEDARPKPQRNQPTRTTRSGRKK